MAFPPKQRGSIFDVLSFAGFQGFARFSSQPSSPMGSSTPAASKPRVANPHGLAPLPSLSEYLAEAPEELRVARPRGLAFHGGPQEEAVLEAHVAWGSIVIGERAGQGWVRCGNVYLPTHVDGVVVLEPRRFEPKLVPKAKPKMPRPPSCLPPGASKSLLRGGGPGSEDSDDDTEEEAEAPPPAEPPQEDGEASAVPDEEPPARLDAGSRKGSMASGGGEEMPAGVDRQRSEFSITNTADPETPKALEAATVGRTPKARSSMSFVELLQMAKSNVSDEEDSGEDSSSGDEAAVAPADAAAVAHAEEAAASAASSAAVVPDKVEAPEMEEKLPVEVRLPAIEPAYWLAPGGLVEPHLPPARCCPDDLHEAALRGDVALLRAMIKAGVPVNAPIRAADSEEFLSLLHLLSGKPPAPNSSRALVELLRSRANPDVRSSSGTTPLMRACLHKNVGAVEVLLHFDASAWPVDDVGRTALRCAIIPDAAVADCEEVAVEIAELLGGAGAPLDHGGSVAPIVEAVMQHNGPAVRALIRLGATPDGLNEAVLSAPVNMISDLIEAKANPFFKDQSGKTTMEIALSRGDETITSMLRDFIGDLERGGHPHLKTREAMATSVTQEPVTCATMNRNNIENFKFEQRRRGTRRSVADRLANQLLERDKNATRCARWSQQLHSFCRRVSRSYTFQTIMLIFLALALFLPDAWVIANLTAVSVLDVLILVIFSAFFVELVVQSVGLQRSYIGKFAFWMDAVGWITVPLDHSVVTEAILHTVSGVDSSTVARVTKLVRVGARAGRLSRLVKLLRFLPGMRDKVGQQTTGTASLMSKTINLRISLQVAAIIITMSVCLPLLDVFRFPQADHSLDLWATLIHRAATEHFDELDILLKQMQQFFDTISMPPFKVVLGSPDGIARRFDLRPPPVRSEDIFEARVAGRNTSVFFDFRRPNVNEAAGNVILILVIVLAMFASSMLISSAVTRVVLLPLQRLLTIVKDVAGSIFISVEALTKAAGARQSEVDADSDEEGGNEARTLEKVLKKLSALSELHVKKSPIEDIDALGKEERALLADYALPAPPPPAAEVEPMSSSRVIQSTGERSMDANFQDEVRPGLTEVGIHWHNFLAWGFDITELSANQRDVLSIGLLKLYKLPEAPESPSGPDLPGAVAEEPVSPLGSDGPASPAGKWGAARRAGLSTRRRSSAARRQSSSAATEDMNITIANFVMAVNAGYAEKSLVPYHNFAHAVDVAVTLHHLFRKVHAAYFLSRHERLALMASALAHDIGHLGFTNDFLINTLDEVALRYNDSSPMESMHCAKLFEIVSKPGTGIFGSMEPSIQREVRRVCVEAILHTDNQRHFAMVKDLEMTWDMNHDIFSAQHVSDDSDDSESSGGDEAHAGAEPAMEVVEFFTTKQDSLRLVQRFFLHYADQSNSMKSFAQSEYWGLQMFEEFFLQGDREKELGLPVHFLRDRERCSVPHAHVQIIELCVAPMAIAAGRLLPGLFACEELLIDNLQAWIQEWKEGGATEEDVAKVTDRVAKFKRWHPKT